MVLRDPDTYRDSVVLCVIKYIITLSYTEGAQSCTEKFAIPDLNDYVIETKYYCIIEFENIKNRTRILLCLFILLSAPIRFIRIISVPFFSDIRLSIYPIT